VAPTFLIGAAGFTWFNPVQVMDWFGVSTEDGPEGLERLGHGLAIVMGVLALLMLAMAAMQRSRAKRRERESDPWNN